MYSLSHKLSISNIKKKKIHDILNRNTENKFANKKVSLFWSRFIGFFNANMTFTYLFHKNKIKIGSPFSDRLGAYNRGCFCVA